MSHDAPSPSGTGSHVRVVVADDAPDVRYLIGMLLESAGEGFEVVAEASSGPGAVLAVERMEPDCLVIDLAMPGGDGIAAIAELRRTRPHLPVVLLTGFTDSEQLRAEGDHGADAVLGKDETIFELAPTIVSVTRQRVG